MEQIYQQAEKRNIEIISRTHKKRKAFCMLVDREHFISVDYSKIHTHIEEKDSIGEEVGHCVTNSLYFIHDFANPVGRQNIEQAESRALDWSAKMQVLPESLQNPEFCHMSVSEVAEYLDVSESTLIRAINYYIRKNVLTVIDGSVQVFKRL